MGSYFSQKKLFPIASFYFISCQIFSFLFPARSQEYFGDSNLVLLPASDETIQVIGFL